MVFLSELIGRPVIDFDSNNIGKVSDLIARPLAQFPHPVVEAIMVRQKEGLLAVPYSATAALTSAAVPLRQRMEEIQPYIPSDHDIFLVRDVLDKQIIDTEGARVVRVNDLELLRVGDTFLVSNVDAGGMGILRRVGIST